MTEIVNYASQTTFSRSILEDIKNTCGYGINEDNVDLSLIEKISLAEEKINKEVRHTNFIGDILAEVGHNTKFPSEGDDLNGN